MESTGDKGLCQMSQQECKKQNPDCGKFYKENKQKILFQQINCEAERDGGTIDSKRLRRCIKQL